MKEDGDTLLQIETALLRIYAEGRLPLWNEGSVDLALGEERKRGGRVSYQ